MGMGGEEVFACFVESARRRRRPFGIYSTADRHFLSRRLGLHCWLLPRARDASSVLGIALVVLLGESLIGPVGFGRCPGPALLHSAADEDEGALMLIRVF